jgi:hypothetical protein
MLVMLTVRPSVSDGLMVDSLVGSSARTWFGLGRGLGLGLGLGFGVGVGVRVSGQGEGEG